MVQHLLHVKDYHVYQHNPLCDKLVWQCMYRYALMEAKVVCYILWLKNQFIFCFVAEHIQPEALLNFPSQLNSRIPLNTMTNNPLKVWPNATVPYILPYNLGKIESVKSMPLSVSLTLSVSVCLSVSVSLSLSLSVSVFLSFCPFFSLSVRLPVSL